jgi:hypothetical protein
MPRLVSALVRPLSWAQVKAELEANAKAARERTECIAGVQWVERFRVWFQHNRSQTFDVLRLFDADCLLLSYLYGS